MTRSKEPLPGMRPSEWHGLEADTLLDAAEEAFDKGNIKRWKRLGDEAMVAARKSFREGLNEIPGVVEDDIRVLRRASGSSR